uniref:(northern house mosquito) hypothetical protein n=1 Tax=Culex pipiens TaxID=7175 RepID=A0A8D8NLD3_CULPI
MERVGPGGLCRAASVPHVPLPARPHQRIPETDAAARLHHPVTYKRTGPRGGKHSLLPGREIAVPSRARLQRMEPRHIRGHAVEEADRAKRPHRLAVAGAGRAERMDQIPVHTATGRDASTAQVLPRAVPQDHEGHRSDREQLAHRKSQPAADKLPVGELEGRLLFAVRRRQDRVRPAGQHHQNLGPQLAPVLQDPHRSHRFGSLPAVRRQGDHQRFQ